MPKPGNSLPILLPSKGWQRYFIRALYSITNFAKASILSILIIIVILLLLTKMEQAYTMLLRMIEDDKISLFVCFVMVNLLALSLSHYPIYTYYAGNLNGSRGLIIWKKVNPLNIPILRWINVYTYQFEKGKPYFKDVYFNILRISLGLLVFAIWAHFIFSAFEVNLIYYTANFDLIKAIFYSSLIFPFLIYFIVRRKLSPSHSNLLQRKKIYKMIGFWYFITLILTVTSFGFLLFYPHLFSYFGLFIMLITTYFMMLNYTFFRLVRPRIYHVLREMKLSSKNILRKLFPIAKYLENSAHYLVFFQLTFYASLVGIIYFNLASVNSWKLPNGLSIVLVYLYFYFFCISSIGKFYFVHFSIAQRQGSSTKEYSLDRLSFKILTFGLVTLVILFVLGQVLESSVNELDKVKITERNDGLKLANYTDSTRYDDGPIYFVSSHGGGLKANSWTLRVLHELQKRSDGDFLNQTIAMSGASGGSLGLALYGDIMGNSKGDMEKIQSTIRRIEYDNYASIDVAMVMGLDAVKNLFPLSRIKNTNDRSYYDMLKYQQHIHMNNCQIPIKSKNSLNNDAFRTYWQKLQKNNVQLPILIMNTASTSGRRGIFCSINLENFNAVFPYAKDLTELKEPDGSISSISFYQSVSTTNRFPVFSPVAKIKGSGHYMDAGAIDNSGMLGCLDLYLFLQQQKKLVDRNVVFVDIENGKSAYAEYILAKFIKSNPKLQLNIDENEKSSLLANIQTGLNLDKIPGYLRDFMIKYEKLNSKVKFKQIYLPYKLNIKDIEAVIDASIEDDEFRAKLKTFLDKNNFQIKSETKFDPGFFDDWQYYAPVLSRQLSISNIRYFEKMSVSNLNGMNELYKKK